MSEKSERLRQKRQGYRLHQARLRGEKKGVSPIVATLILILIAVAAAAFLYLWLVVWQGNITGGIGQPHAQSILTVGGSTSAYPFTSLAASWFEQNNSDVTISDNQGGTSAGLLAVCAGNIDIAASTTPETVSSLESTDGCSSTYASTIQITPIAYDAVDVVIPTANTHGLLSLNWDTLALVYDGASTTQPTLVPTTLNGVALPTGYPTETTTAVTPLDWSQIPAAVNGATIGTLGTEEIESAGATGTTGPACAAPYAADICAATFGTTATPCGWSVCASGAVAIAPYERADAAGATLSLEAKLFGAVSNKAFASSFSNLGYSGCGSNNLLSDCGITLPSAQQQTGDTGVLNAVAGNAAGIGYASDGLARSTTGIALVPFAAVGQVSALGVPQSGSGFSVTTGTTTAYNGIIPTTGSTGTIAAGITSSTTVNNYAGWRPFLLVSLEPYSGVAQEFVTFITDPANNVALAAATHEVSIYQI